jgi:outer membrane lipoprotein LolB
MSFCLTRRCAAIALPLLLTACASIAPPAPRHEAQGAPQAVPVRPFHDAVDPTGRLSVHYQRNDKDEALHGSFVWNQTASQTTVTLLSPLGQTMAIITATPAGATLTQGGQPARSATDVDALTAQTLGWPLPVAGLRDWLQGFALDRTGKRVIATPQASHLRTFDGWQIQYENWAEEESFPAQLRPKRIDLARYTQQAGDVSIRIVIDTWQAH